MPIIQNGQGLEIAVPPGQSIAIASLTGTYSATLLDGAGLGVLASASAGGATYGPYPAGATIRVSAGIDSCVTYDVGAQPVAKADLVAHYKTDEDGNVAGLAAPGGGQVDMRRSANKSRCATRLYSTMLSNTTSAALVGYGFPGPTKVTHALLAETEVEFDAVSLIVQNTSGAALTWGNLKASSVREVPTFNTKITETLSGTFSGASSISVAAGSATSPTFAISDPIPLSSVPRTDGGPRPLVLFTVETDTASDGSTQLGSWYRGGGNNTTKTHDGGRVMACSTLPGSVAPASLTPSLTNPDVTSAIVGFVYWSRGAKVLTVMESGNSITAGNNLPVANRGHLIRAVEEVSTPSSPVEYMVCGLPGQGLAQIFALANKVITLGRAGGGMLPGVVIFNPFDTNANVGSNIVVGPMRSASARLESSVQESGGVLMLADGLPRQSDANTKAWLNDQVRRDFNASLGGDFGAAVIRQAGALEDPGRPGFFLQDMVSGDFVHPSLNGDDLIKIIQGAAIRSVL